MGAQVVQSVDRNDTVQRHGSAGVDAGNAPMGDRRADKSGMQHAVEMNVVEIARFTAQ